MRAASTAMLGMALLLAPAERAAAQSYMFRNYGADAGMDAARALALDGDGQLLIGTDDGLLRFDGRDVARVPLPSAHAAVQRLAAAANGDVWVLVQSGRLFLLRTSGEIREIALPSALIAAVPRAQPSCRLRVDPAGDVWINDPDAGLWSFDSKSSTWRQSTIASDAPLTDFFFASTRTMWLATHDHVGTAVVDGGRIMRPVWRWAFNDVVFIRLHPGQQAWVGTKHGVFLTAENGSARQALGSGFAVWGHNEPAADAIGNLLLVGGYGDGALGLFELSPDGTVRLSSRTHPLLENRVLRQEIFDPEHGFWVAHDAGISQLEQDYLVSYAVRSGDGISETPRDLQIDPFGRGLWISTWGGVYRLHDGQVERVSERIRRPASAVVTAHDRSVWWTEDLHRGFALTGARRVSATDEHRNLLFESASGVRYSDAPVGLVRDSASRGRAVVITRQQLTPTLVAEGAGGRMWFSPQFRGIDTIDEDSLASECRACASASVRSVIVALRDIDLRAMRADAAGRIWIASFGGLICLWRDAHGAWHHTTFGRQNGLLSDDVLSVAPGRSGRLWVGTARGLQAFRVIGDTPALQPVFELRARDGLDGESVTAVVEDAHGAVWFASGEGRVYRLADDAVLVAPSPAVRIARIDVDGVSQPVAALPLTVRAGTGTLGVQLSVRTLRRAAQVHIEYRFEPADRHWTDLGTDRTLRFGALTPGAHALLARAVRPGEIPGPITQLTITATIPLYRRWWFPVLVTALAAGLSLLFYRAYMHRRLALERLRTRIATDLHDDIGGGLTQISLYGALIRRESDARVGAWADAVGAQARQLSETMRDLVWAIDPERESWEALELRMKDWAAELVAPTSIGLNMTGVVDVEGVSLSADIRRNVLLIFKEALHNAVRHAGCSSIEVRWRVSHDWLSLRIRDDGTGFEECRGSKAMGNGLRNIARRAAEIGAQVGVQSASGHGTTIEIQLPLRRGAALMEAALHNHPNM